MTAIQTFYFKLLSTVQYAIGSSLFYSGVAGWSKHLHGFAMKQLQRASHKHHEGAQKLMASLLTYRGETAIDKRAGVALLHTAAQQGDAQSQFLYAEALLKSDVILPTTHQSSALSWYEAAAEQGHAMAALRLSKAYAAGSLGLEKNEKKAQYWSEKFMQHSQNMSPKK